MGGKKGGGGHRERKRMGEKQMELKAKREKMVGKEKDIQCSPVHSGYDGMKGFV